MVYLTSDFVIECGLLSALLCVIFSLASICLQIHRCMFSVVNAIPGNGVIVYEVSSLSKTFYSTWTSLRKPFCKNWLIN